MTFDIFFPLDINECKETPEVCMNGKCKNTNGTFECECQKGYIYSRASGKCLDVDECKDSNPCKNADCVNTAGSFKCKCRTKGETLDSTGLKCEGTYFALPLHPSISTFTGVFEAKKNSAMLYVLTSLHVGGPHHVCFRSKESPPVRNSTIYPFLVISCSSHPAAPPPVGREGVTAALKT